MCKDEKYYKIVKIKKYYATIVSLVMSMKVLSISKRDIYITRWAKFYLVVNALLSGQKKNCPDNFFCFMFNALGCFVLIFFCPSGT